MSEPIKNSDGDSLLHLAVICGDTSALRLVLEESYSTIERVDVDVTNDQGQTPLLWAFITGNFVAATTLLDHGANASKADRKGDTPFHWLHTFEASQMRTLVDVLLKQKADVNAISSRQLWDNYYQMAVPGGTPLQRAVARNKSEAVKILLDCGADALLPAPASELSTPLWIACTYHNFKVLELLLDSIKNADVKKVVNGGESEKWPLGQPTLDAGYYFMNGATWGRMVRHCEKHSLSVKATIETLSRRGAHQWLARSASEEGRGTLLIQAVMNHSLDIVEAVLDIYPSSINIPGRQKMTPLHRAVLRDREDLVNLLLSRGADPFATRLDGLDALSLYANYRQGLKIPRILLQKGLRFEVPSSGFQTPFFGAVKNRAFEQATYILENTAEPGLMINASCVRGTNFHSPQVRVSILKYLLDEGAIFSLRALRYLLHLPDTYGKVDFIVLPSEGKSALHHLASYPRNIRDDVVGRALAVEILQYFSSSEEINLAGSLDGKTALWQAVRSLNYDMIDLLLSKGASPTIRSHDGQTPLSLLFIQIDHSKKHHHDDVIKLEQIKNLFAKYGYSPVDPGNVLE